MNPATISVNPYTKNGARFEIAATKPPSAGPVRPPIKNPPVQAEEARPRSLISTTFSRSAIDANVYMVLPTPPMPRAIIN